MARTGVLARDQSDITADLLAALKPLGSSDAQHEGQRRQRAYAPGESSAAALRTVSSLLARRLRLTLEIRGFNPGPAAPADPAGAGRPRERAQAFSNWARPASLHSFFFRRWPSFIARACS